MVFKLLLHTSFGLTSQSKRKTHFIISIFSAGNGRILYEWMNIHKTHPFTIFIRFAGVFFFFLSFHCHTNKKEHKSCRKTNKVRETDQCTKEKHTEIKRKCCTNKELKRKICTLTYYSDHKLEWLSLFN